MIEVADAPLRLPHAVVPHGQIPGDDGHSVTPEGQGANDDDLGPPDEIALRKMFDESRDVTDKARKEQQTDQDYYDGPAQLNSEVRRILEMRKQPAIFDNRIAPAIDGILGVIEGAKVDPRGFPRNPQDQSAADICTKTLRYAADVTRWQQTKLECAEDYLKQGLTAAVVEWDDKQIRVEQIRWETFFYDPKSRKANFKDAKYLGIAKWMYEDEVRKAYPRAKQLGDLCTVHDNAIDNTWDDRPTDGIRWVDKRRNRVLVVEMYYQHSGEWLRCVFCGAGWLEHDRSPYRNARTGETRCPIEAQSFKVDRQNNRYGPIRNMRPMQDEVNARRSRGLHLLNARQVQNIDITAPPVDAEVVRQEMARADGIVPTGWQAVQTTDMASGNLSMLAEAKDSLSRMVPVALAQDLREGSAASGRARQVAQQAGLTQFGRGFGRLEDFEERIYEQMWLTAQQFWTDPMYIRVTDDPRAPSFMQINIPQMAPALVQQPDGTMAVGEQQVGTQHAIAEMDMDIIIGTSPDSVALEQEVFEALMGLVQKGLDVFSPQFELLIEMSPLPDKTRVLERLKAFRDQVQQQQAQAQQAAQEAQQRAQQIGEAKAVADIEKTNADAEYTKAKAQGQNVDNEVSALHALYHPGDETAA